MKYTKEIGRLENEYIVRNNEDGSQTYIPMDEANSDYQAYLRWLENPDAEEGGTL